MWRQTHVQQVLLRKVLLSAQPLASVLPRGALALANPAPRALLQVPRAMRTGAACLQQSAAWVRHLTWRLAEPALSPRTPSDSHPAAVEPQQARGARSP